MQRNYTKGAPLSMGGNSTPGGFFFFIATFEKNGRSCGRLSCWTELGDVRMLFFSFQIENGENAEFPRVYIIFFCENPSFVKSTTRWR